MKISRILKQKQTIRILAGGIFKILALSSLFSIAPAAAYQQEFYPGNVCQPKSSRPSDIGYLPGSIFNYSFKEQFVYCPVEWGNYNPNSTDELMVVVWVETLRAGKIKCQIDARDQRGNLKDFFAASKRSGANVISSIKLKIDANHADYSIQCDLPPKSKLLSYSNNLSS